ncbi:ABC transporter permease [Flavihumibacter fluvii]|uniref:ABC transporter permease n=1 Tax=Flavihumibacter fluvii TaxID=2838157 RepID=UPI001BDDF73A|nr:FtsX-like permease family protein [Flavihumibacter fluvii]ULQ51602.1 ABC transporter permease [Flavihumibacter fluvii]
MIISIAWRNIWRNPMRSLVIIGSVMIGLWAGIFILAFFRGMTNEQINTTISQQLSHVQVHHPRFREMDETEFTISKLPALQIALENDKRVTAVSQRMILTSMASSPYTSSGVSLMGIEPLKENAVTGLSKRIKEGKYLDGQSASQLLMGNKLAVKLHLKINSKVILTFQNTKGELTAAAFRIRGIYSAANSTLEENLVYVNRQEIDTLAFLNGQIHELAILLTNNNDLEPVSQSLKDLKTGNKIETWKELSPELRLMIDSFGQYMLIIIGVILVALVFGIINTMLMAVLERYRELGVLMAIGLNKRKVFTMIMTETFFMTGLGCASGLPLARLTIFLSSRNGINLSKYSEGLAMYGYGTRVYPQLESIYYWEVGALALIAGLIAAIYPALKALQLNPSVAIRKI